MTSPFSDVPIQQAIDVHIQESARLRLQVIALQGQLRESRASCARLVSVCESLRQAVKELQAVVLDPIVEEIPE